MSSTSIFVHFGKVPPADQNGIILRYTITYTGIYFASPQNKFILTAPTRQATLIRLHEYTNYSITVFASTAFGNGPVSTPIFVITNEDSKCSLIIQFQAIIPLYVNQKINA